MKFLVNMRPHWTDVDVFYPRYLNRGRLSYISPKIEGDTVLANGRSEDELTKLSLKYHKFLYYRDSLEDSVLIVLGEPKTLVKYLSDDWKTQIKKALDMFGLAHNEKPDDDKPRRGKKEVIVDHPNVLRLKEIIKRCPSVTVERPELVKPKHLKQMLLQKIKLGFSRRSDEYDIARILNRYIYLYENLNTSCNDKSVSTVYRYPATKEQYLALTLMQSYGTPFDSCQYLPLHNFYADDITEYLRGTITREFRELACGYGNFCLEQGDDYDNVLCDRFFKLTKDGFVNSRFSLYHNRDSECSLSNFYNCTAFSTVKVNGMTIESEAYGNFEFSGESYYNSESYIDKRIAHFYNELERV